MVAGAALKVLLEWLDRGMEVVYCTGIINRALNPEADIDLDERIPAR